MKRLLIVAFSSFDLVYILSKILEDENDIEIDIICNVSCIPVLSETTHLNCRLLYTFDDRVGKRQSFDNIISLFKIRNYMNKRSLQYKEIYFGAYRHAYTSIFIKKLKSRKNIRAISQVNPKIQSYEVSKHNVRTYIQSIVLSIFGYSDFIPTRLRGQFPKNSEYLMNSMIWRNDPFYTNNVEFISDNNVDTRPSLRPSLFTRTNVSSRKKEEKTRSKIILVIGERTPVLHFNYDLNESIISKCLSIIENENSHIFVRARINLSSYQYYRKHMNFVSLDPDQLLHKQLLELNPDLVFSFKSTASSIAADLGFKSYVLYPLLELPMEVKNHCDNLLSSSKVEKVQSFSYLRQVLTS